MSTAATFTKSGTKSATPAKLNAKVFGLKVESHQLLKDAYLAYLANGRVNLAVVKKRGQVSGGGIKPWRQKGTGRARFGSSRNPIWRGGGVAFGPTGEENYTRKLSVAAKRQAIRQALSLAATEEKLKVIEAFAPAESKVKASLVFLAKIGAEGKILLVVENKDAAVDRATRNLPNVICTQAAYVNVYDVMNADHIVITKKALEIIELWLGETK